MTNENTSIKLFQNSGFITLIKNVFSFIKEMKKRRKHAHGICYKLKKRSQK